MTDEEKLELVRRCTRVIAAHGHDYIDAKGFSVEGRRQCQVGDLTVDSWRPMKDQDIFAPTNENKVKGRIELRYKTFMVFSVPHRSNVRPAVLAESMWRHTEFGRKALVALQQFMVLDDLAEV